MSQPVHRLPQRPGTPGLSPRQQALVRELRQEVRSHLRELDRLRERIHEVEWARDEVIDQIDAIEDNPEGFQK